MQKTTPLPNGDLLVLLETEKAYGGPSNLLLVGKEGRAVWEAELVEGAPYTDVKFEDGKLTAVSWACYLAEIDLQTGTIKSAVFTK
ncbi:MAG: hypothetical protein JSR47_03350 [Proteobacteria bacterium]|nr:hypothetical protein [Pseudomonadota bacterium]